MYPCLHLLWGLTRQGEGGEDITAGVAGKIMRIRMEMGSSDRPKASWVGWRDRSYLTLLLLGMASNY